MVCPTCGRCSSRKDWDAWEEEHSKAKGRTRENDGKGDREKVEKETVDERKRRRQNEALEWVDKEMSLLMGVITTHRQRLSLIKFLQSAL